ncbi:MAG TPA: serine--tRNA ligase, partial [Baekduia sp.]|nr:serine--tRNA ligase [Baekduia sp.]
MLDVKLLRQDPDGVRAALARRGDAGPLDRVLELDARRRALVPQAEGLRADQKRAGEEIARAKQQGADASEAMA